MLCAIPSLYVIVKNFIFRAICEKQLFYTYHEQTEETAKIIIKPLSAFGASLDRGKNKINIIYKHMIQYLPV